MINLNINIEKKSYVGAKNANISKIINSNIIQFNTNVNENERMTIRFNAPQFLLSL